MSVKTQQFVNSKSTWMGSLVLLPFTSFVVFESQYLHQYYDPKSIIKSSPIAKVSQAR